MPLGQRMFLSEYMAKKREAESRKQKRKEKAAVLWPKKIKRGKSPSHADLEKKRWTIFSILIRRRDNKRYSGKCFFCRKGPIEAAGHLISRQRLSTRYDLWNVFGVCNACNFKDRFQEGYHDQCVSVYILNFGPVKYQELVALSRSVLHESKADIIEATRKFERMVQTGIA